MANQIQLRGGFRKEEAVASGTVTPGMLLEMTSATADTVKAHASPGGYAERIVAVEDALQGGIVTDDYATTAHVTYHVMDAGAVANMLIAAGENIAKGDELISEGTGMLLENGSEGSGVTVYQVIGIAMEACDLSASGAVDTLCAVRLL